MRSRSSRTTRTALITLLLALTDQFDNDTVVRRRGVDDGRTAE